MNDETLGVIEAEAATRCGGKSELERMVQEGRRMQHARDVEFQQWLEGSEHYVEEISAVEALRRAEQRAEERVREEEMSVVDEDYIPPSSDSAEER